MTAELPAFIRSTPKRTARLAKERIDLRVPGEAVEDRKAKKEQTLRVTT